MTQTPDQLIRLAERVRAEGAQQETVRTVLSWYGYTRRGSWISRQINDAMKLVGVVCEPVFENAYIDEYLRFSVDPLSVRQEVARDGAEHEAAPDPIVTATAIELVPRVGLLPAANSDPVVVQRDDPLERATTLMLLNDYSQLPVMQGERTVHGHISWKTIGRARIRTTEEPTLVRDCMETAVEILDSSEPLFSATKRIIDNEFVLVRGKDQAITGLVTTSDLGEQFKDLSEAFLSIGEIEHRVRQLASGRFHLSELRACTEGNGADDAVSGLSDLNFGDYIRLIENPERWQRLNLKLDRKTTIDRLHVVRKIRNDVMHFRPDGVSDDDLEILTETLRFLQTILTQRI